MLSFTVGTATRSLPMCEQLFKCPSSPAHALLTNALSDTPTNDEPSLTRTTCTAAGNLCPTVSIACALCGVFLPGQCGDQCIIAGLYCGVSAYACKAKAKKEAEMMEPAIRGMEGYLFPGEREEVMEKMAKMQPRHLFACYNYWAQQEETSRSESTKEKVKDENGKGKGKGNGKGNGNGNKDKDKGKGNGNKDKDKGKGKGRMMEELAWDEQMFADYYRGIGK